MIAKLRDKLVNYLRQRNIGFRKRATAKLNKKYGLKLTEKQIFNN